MSKRPLVTKEIAERFGVSEKTVRRWHKKGALPGSFKMAGKGSPIKMSVDALSRLMNRKGGV